MKHDQDEFAPEIPDYSVPDYSEPQFRSRRSSQPKPEKPVRKQIHEYFLRAFSKDAPMGQLIRSHTETIDAHSSAILENEATMASQTDKIQTLETTVTELEATNAVLAGQVKALEEMVLELIDASTAKE